MTISFQNFKVQFKLNLLLLPIIALIQSCTNYKSENLQKMIMSGDSNFTTQYILSNSDEDKSTIPQRFLEFSTGESVSRSW